VADSAEQDPACQECGSPRASWSLAWDRYLCADCRRRWTDRETKDGGRHPVKDNCSCKNCREAKIAVRQEAGRQVRITPGGPAP
jgi:hypothetical protein